VAAQIDGTTIPSTFNNRGRYAWKDAPIVARNGRGEAVTAGGASVTWTFDMLNATEFAWWYTTVLAGAASKLCSNNRLWNALGTETAYSSAIVLRPEWERVQAGAYWNVTIKIEQIFV